MSEMRCRCLFLSPMLIGSRLPVHTDTHTLDVDARQARQVFNTYARVCLYGALQKNVICVDES